MDALGRSIEQDKDLVQIPNLDWLTLSKDNIPSEFPVESIPQLQDAWTHTPDTSTRLISNATMQGGMNMKKASKEDIDGVVKQAKKDMMMGYTGKALAERLSSMYMPDLILAAKDELTKLASEQGLLGNVYIDLTPFESCHEAAKILGKNKVRTARYVVGNPTRKVCSSHHNGFCKELNKRVKNAMDYSDATLSEYTDHLRIAGVIGSSEKIASKENLREAFLRTYEAPVVEVSKEASSVDVNKIQNDFSVELEKSAASREKQAAERRFFEARPILAYLQDQLLKGKVGNSLKESIRQRFSSVEVSKFSQEIAKVASLQGLLGNIFVDISYYKNPEEAIQAIKTANTNPIYLVQSYKKHDHDNSLAKVASATGCTELPRDGKLDRKVAYSYIRDLQSGNRIASDVSNELMNRVISGDTSLQIIKEAFDATLSHKKGVRTGGVQAVAAVMGSKKAVDHNAIRENVSKAIEAGVSLDQIEDKVATMIGTTEAVGMVRKVLSSATTVNANCLSKCTSERYDLSRTASIQPTAKCKECVLKGASSCIKQSASFLGAIDLNKAFFDIKEAGDKKPEIDPHTKNVQLKDNPDVQRKDMEDDYEIKDDSGMNVALDNIRESSTDLDVEMGSASLDSYLK